MPWWSWILIAFGLYVLYDCSILEPKRFGYKAFWIKK